MTDKPQRQRVVRRALHGVLLLDKPLGLSSNDALQKAKWLLRAEKAGHTGTLDPLATGLLPLCFGAATKFSQVSLDADKEYIATLRLGVRTSTGDAEGEVLETRPVEGLSRGQIEAACARHVGLISQLPPMHSALKHEGKALYDYARQGITVEREPREVTIHSIAILDWQHEALVIRVRCSKGTYIRTLAEDIGALLGCGASLSALRRTASGAVQVEDAITLDALAAMSEDERLGLLRPPDCLLQDWPAVSLEEEDASRFLNGLRRRLPPGSGDQSQVRVYGIRPPVLLGSASIAEGQLIPSRLLSPQEVAGLAASSSAEEQVTRKVV
ncbi:tRNA pseudouridine(55) synthase TruB [Pelomonas sp. SE-A7]|uniref:tRNA pseudouridine(55) synthase TruB n=1 Tax=Pelomonas sp. SE-A7 TaxID=3054953 RepID=UPI00259C7BBD|nr:tRNA pseudouridine(55) synthase TruB [Pelomonas sp. SE-A7]MDM4765431.1 tRNA pseudouridine(55) synthase TruB [Pelomonas sp. SE-A7]